MSVSNNDSPMKQTELTLAYFPDSFPRAALSA